MPYISQKDRSDYQSHLDIIKAELDGKSIGHLVYVISYLLLPKNIQELEKRKYTDHNAILGAVESAKLDYFARVMIPYECKKIQENGELLA